MVLLSATQVTKKSTTGASEEAPASESSRQVAAVSSMWPLKLEAV
jgi:hypothetical protein